MVQPSFFVAMTAIFSIAVNVHAIPINIDIDASKEISENVLEARMFRRIGVEVGKQVYSRVGDAVLHGRVSLSQSGPSDPPGLLRPSTGQSHTPLTRPGSLIPKMDPIKVPNMAQKSSIGLVTAASKGKNIDWGASQPPSFDPKKVGLAKEAPSEKASPKVKVGGKPKAKEAPF